MLRVSGQRSMVHSAAWPASFMLFAGYPDSMLTALTIWSVYAARRERWLQAGALGFLAGLTKAAGALVIVPLAVIARSGHRLRIGRGWRDMIWLLVPVAVAADGQLTGRPSQSERS